MKYRTIWLAMASAAMLCACNKNDDNAQALPAWVEDETLPVPIEFGPSVTTKAAVEQLGGAPLGIFGVDLEDGTELLCHLAECKGSENILKFVDEVGGKETPQCYPLGSTSNFSFYGYHVGSEDIEGSYEQISGAYYRELELGNADVLWAKSVATPIWKDGVRYDGFNARYSRVTRTMETPSAYYPELNFEHVTTAFHFVVKAYDQAAEDSFADGQVRITSVSLSNVATEGKLIICDRQDPAREGKVEQIGQLGTLTRTGFEAGPTLDGTEVSDGFFLIPGAYRNTQLTFEVTTNPVGTPTKYIVDSLPLPAGKTAFEAGKSYTFVIVIKSFDEIVIKTTITDWEGGFSAEEEENQDNVLITIE